MGYSHSLPLFPGVGWTVGCRHGSGVPTLSLPSHGTLGWDGQWDAGMGGGTVWDVLTLSLYSHGTLGWDGVDSGIQACGVVKFGMFPLCPFLHMVHWEMG